MLVKTVRAALALLLIILAAAAHAQTTVTLQQGLNSYTGATDNWISCCRTANAPNENYGSEVEVDMRLPGDFGLYRFNIFQSEGGPVPNGATITSATLSLYKAFGGDGVFKASRLLKNWTELGSTWNATGTGTQWSTAGAQGAGTDVLATADGQGSAPDSAANNCADGIGHDICWVNINVTTGVQAFANGSSQNFGWLVQMVSSSATGAYKDFNSKDSTNFPLFRPKLTVTYTPASGTTAVLQQGLNNYAGATDNWISCCRTANAPNENYGSQVEIDMRLPGDFGLYRFNIFQSEGGPVPNGATINSAILSLYKSFGSDAVFKASRLLKNWTELGSTWNSTGTGTQWSTAGAQGAGTDVLATADGQGSAPDSAANNCADGVGHEICWLNINVTSGVQAFASGAAQNFGWLVQMVSSSATGAYKDFNSKDSTTFPQYRPKLTINYSGGTPPSCTVPTAAFTASPSSALQPPLDVTFNASTSTDGSSPITSLRLQFGDATPDVTWSSKTQTQLHTYTTATVFNTTLTAANACGTSAPVSHTINIGAGPTAQLTATSTQGAPLTFDFDASGSTPGSAAITALRLAFGDNTPDATWTVTTQHQSHTYAARPTPYTATLTVTDANGATSTKTVQVTASSGSGSASDDCSAPGLSVCVTFEQAQTQFSNPPRWPNDPGTVTSTALGGFQFSVQNGVQPWDSATDTTRITLVPGGRDGSMALKLTTHPGDVNHGSGSWDRDDLLTESGGASGAEPGQTWWWARSVYLPDDFHLPGPGEEYSVLWDWHDDCSGRNLSVAAGQAPINMKIENGQMHIRVYGGDRSDPNAEFSGQDTGRNVIDSQPQRNVWYDFVEYVHWASDNTGIYRLWLRKGNETTYRLVFRNDNIPNMWQGCLNGLKLADYHGNYGVASSILHDRIRGGNVSTGATWQSVAIPGVSMTPAPESLP